MRRSTRVVRPGGARRETVWIRDNITDTLATGSHYKTYDLASTFKAAGGNTQGLTVVRAHLSIAVWSVVASGDQMAYGLVRGQNTDVGTDIVGAPTPIADPYEDWAFWDIRTASNAGGSGCYSRTGLTNAWEIDVKAMRRIPEIQMTFNLVMQTAVVGATLDFSVVSSVLAKLP